MSPLSVTSAIRSFVVVLSAVGYTTAQIPLGLSMVPNPVMTGSSDPAPPYPSDSGSNYNSPPPSYSYPSYSGSSLSSVLPLETGTPSYGAPPSQYTPPPSESSYPYQQMPYSSFTNGGYSQMDCGYGYKKGSDGKCDPESWVRVLPLPLFSEVRPEEKFSDCCRVCADRRCLFFPVG